MSIPIEGYEEACINCRFFVGGLDGEPGVCRRYPPVLVHFQQIPLGTLWMQPHTQADYWCGEYQVNIELSGHQRPARKDENGTD